MSAEELAKLAQNPVGNLISLPFQNNTNLNFGPEKGTQNILNIQPVIPISVNEEWNIITRTIVPVDLDALARARASTATGVGDTVFTAFLSPAKPGKWIWGAGPVVQIPTNSNRNSATGTGASDPRSSCCTWTMAARGSTACWSTTSGRSPATRQGGSYNNGLIQPFVNYNFPEGFYLTTAPILTVDWKADSGERWTIPIGGGVGKIFHLGKLPVNTQLSAYYNVSGRSTVPTGRSARKCN